MFGLKMPVVAAAGALGVLALGGVTGLPKQALADEGGGGASSSSSSSSAASSSASASGMDVSPATVAPGGVVNLHLKASCKAGATAQASAEVFVDAVTLAPAGDGWDGTAFIKSDATDGSYSVSVRCNGSTSSASATVTVTSGGGGGHSPLVPVNPVPAGGGGTAKVLTHGGPAQLAAGPAAAGTSTGPLLVTGAVAAAGVAGLVVHRRRGAARG
ncbi:hypothetical protein [Streptomyces sp. NPDC020983]|uniref:hypothetical protein n=1 Tax=Streptomyces sp. NPDC020983 TaxID=3365106 RepID=UPI0037988CF3